MKCQWICFAEIYGIYQKYVLEDLNHHEMNSTSCQTTESLQISFEFQLDCIHFKEKRLNCVVEVVNICMNFFFWLTLRKDLLKVIRKAFCVEPKNVVSPISKLWKDQFGISGTCCFGVQDII